MSLRRAATPAAGPSPDVAQLQKELGDLKAAAVAANATDGFASASVEAAANTPGFESLSGVEKSAASLGVHPDSWKPIGFMNVRCHTPHVTIIGPLIPLTGTHCLCTECAL